MKDEFKINFMNKLKPNLNFIHVHNNFSIYYRLSKTKLFETRKIFFYIFIFPILLISSHISNNKKFPN